MSLLILAAPAAFKGTLGPRQVAEALAAGVQHALPEASVLQCPLSDGGDGLLDAVLPRGSTASRRPSPPSESGHCSTEASGSASRTPAASASATWRGPSVPLNAAGAASISGDMPQYAINRALCYIS